MSQLNNSATKIEIEKENESKSENVLINVYNTNKDTNEATSLDKKSVNNVNIKPNDNDTTNKNQTDIKEEIVNISILNSNHALSNNQTINTNFYNNINNSDNTNNDSTKNINNINNDTNNGSKQINVLLNEDDINELNKINRSNSIDNSYNVCGNNGMSISISSKKSIRTAIKYDLNKKERIPKTVEEEESEEEKDVVNEGKQKVSRYCPVCKAKTSFMCSACGPVVFYCSQSCQIAHWPEHRLVCKGVKRTKSIVEPKRTESIFGEMIDPTVGSDIIVGTRNVAQFINLKRRNENNNRSQYSSFHSSMERLLSDNFEEEDRDDDNKTENNKDNYLRKNKEKEKNSDDNIAIADDGDNTYSIPIPSNENNDETNIHIANTSLVNRYTKNKRISKLSYRKRASLILEKAREDEEFIEDLKFYIKQIFLIIKPVLLCIFLTIIWVKLTNINYSKVEVIPFYVNNRRSYFKGDPSIDSNTSTGKKILVSLKDAFYFLL